jgi:ferric-dicitrate binding protein FerR (iron transport regulator)
MKPKTNIEEHLFKNLENYQSIDIEEDWKKVRGRLNKETPRRLYPFWRMAAAVILLLGVGFIAQKYRAPSPEMITVVSGEQMKEVVLPDGSMVTLNRQAELVYPEKFNRRQRDISLIGEAFFEVARNPSKPFQVDVDQKALVRVLGTSFNINHDASSERISVQVLEGKVAFSSSEGSNEVILVKDEQATLSGGVIARVDTADRNFLSWKTGKLFFDNASIGEVINELQAHYQVEMELHMNVPEKLSFTSTIDNQDLESVLDEIALVLGLEYRYENEKVVFTLPE